MPRPSSTKPRPARSMPTYSTRVGCGVDDVALSRSRQTDGHAAASDADAVVRHSTYFRGGLGIRFSRVWPHRRKHAVAAGGRHHDIPAEADTRLRLCRVVQHWEPPQVAIRESDRKPSGPGCHPPTEVSGPRHGVDRRLADGVDRYRRLRAADGSPDWRCHASRQSGGAPRIGTEFRRRPTSMSTPSIRNGVRACLTQPRRRCENSPTGSRAATCGSARPAATSLIGAHGPRRSYAWRASTQPYSRPGTRRSDRSAPPGLAPDPRSSGIGDR